MEHKAFVLDYDRFKAELAPVLYRALETSAAQDVIAFIRDHQAELRIPAEGDPLPPDWEAVLRAGSVDRAGAIALTRYYDPTDDLGLRYRWQELHTLFPDNAMLLGVPFGPPHHPFDPGKMGSWFQSPEMVRKHGAATRELALRQPDAGLGRCLSMFGKAVEKGAGLYVTF